MHIEALDISFFQRPFRVIRIERSYGECVCMFEIDFDRWPIECHGKRVRHGEAEPVVPVAPVFDPCAVGGGDSGGHGVGIRRECIDGTIFVP